MGISIGSGIGGSGIGSSGIGGSGISGSSFSPLDLSPLAWARSRISTLYQDPAGTTPVTGAGQDVGAVDDQGSVGGLWSQVTATARPTYEIGPARRVYDPDDALPRTLPAISGGQIVIISPAGTWIDDFNFAGGTFAFGPDTYTGGPAGLMSLLGNEEIEIIILSTPMTAAQQAKMVAYAQGLGSAGLITLGAELFVNGGFDTDTNWIKGAGWSIGSGVATHAAGTAGALTQAEPVVAGTNYLIGFTISGRTAGRVIPVMISGTTAAGEFVDGNESYRDILTANPGNLSVGLSAEGAFDGSADNLSLREVIMP